MNTTKYLETTNNYYRHCNIIIFQWDIKNATHIGSYSYLTYNPFFIEKLYKEQLEVILVDQTISKNYWCLD